MVLSNGGSETFNFVVSVVGWPPCVNAQRNSHNVCSEWSWSFTYEFSKKSHQ